MISRRMVTAGAAASLLAPAVSRGAAAAPLTFIPQSDLTILDPVVTTVYTARNHGYMVFDTLFGMDSQYQMKPQMLDGVSLAADGTIWNLTLRDGLLWHDGEPVLARDCVASIRRWAVRDGRANRRAPRRFGATAAGSAAPAEHPRCRAMPTC